MIELYNTKSLENHWVFEQHPLDEVLSQYGRVVTTEDGNLAIDVRGVNAEIDVSFENVLSRAIQNYDDFALQGNLFLDSKSYLKLADLTREEIAGLNGLPLEVFMSSIIFTLQMMVEENL